MATARQPVISGPNEQQMERQALLEAINEAASGLKKPINQKQQSELLSQARVSQGIQRDLMSNASRPADMKDFREDKSLKSSRLEKPLPSNQGSRQDDQVSYRSLKSEFDYGNKKKFVDVLGNLTTNAHLNRLRQEHARVAGQGVMKSDAATTKRSGNSGVSGASNFFKSQISQYKQMKMAREAAMSPLNEQSAEDELEAKPEDFLACTVCQKLLSQDEKIINARFVNEAMANCGDITIFPVCIKCNFDNLLLNKKVREQQLGALLNEDKPNFFPTSKRLFDEGNLHLNSEEFKQLGTLHQENRTAPYFASEHPQPKVSPVVNTQNLEKADTPTEQVQQPKQRTSIADSGRAIMESDKSRAKQLNEIMRAKMEEESRRQSEINEELNRSKAQKLASRSESGCTGISFPITTNQEFINQDVHDKAKPVDKANFKKKNQYMAYP